MFSYARVVDVHPEAHAVDVVLMQDGRRLSGVQILAPRAGGDFGTYGLGIPTETGYDAKTTQKRDVFAVIGWTERNPFVLGFLYPQVTQVLFEDKERSIDRHPSDVYSTIDGDGNFEMHHPSGAFVRIGVSPKHEDLSGKDYCGLWKIAKNTDKKVHIHVEQANGTYLDIDENGNVVVHAPQVLVDAPMTRFTGRVTIDGSLYVEGEIGSAADVVAGDGQVSLLEHKHENVRTGLEVSGGPIGGAGMPTKDDFEPDGHLS